MPNILIHGDERIVHVFTLDRSRGVATVSLEESGYATVAVADVRRPPGTRPRWRHPAAIRALLEKRADNVSGEWPAEGPPVIIAGGYRGEWKGGTEATA